MIEKTRIITGIGSEYNQKYPFCFKSKGSIHHFDNPISRIIYEIANSEHFYIQIQLYYMGKIILLNFKEVRII